MAKTVYFGDSLSSFKEKLKSGKGGCFVFYGEEELLKRYYLDKLISLIEKEGMPDFNLSKIDFGRKCTLGDLEDEVGMLPVMGEHRLIIVSGLEIMKLSAEDTKRLQKILTDLPEFLYVVIYQSENEFLPDKDAQKKSQIKALLEVASFVPFPLQNEKTLFAWCQKVAGSEKTSISLEAFRLLLTLTEGRMQPMRNELDKLIMYAISQNRTEITRDDVVLFVEGNPEFALYQLNDAVMLGDIEATENILASLKRHKTEPVVIVASLSRTMVGALFAICGATPENAKIGAGLRDWQLDNLKKKVYGKKKENFETALSLCLETDKKIKSFNADPFLLCESLSLELARLLK